MDVIRRLVFISHVQSSAREVFYCVICCDFALMQYVCKKLLFQIFFGFYVLVFISSFLGIFQ